MCDNTEIKEDDIARNATRQKLKGVAFWEQPGYFSNFDQARIMRATIIIRDSFDISKISTP